MLRLLTGALRVPLSATDRTMSRFTQANRPLAITTPLCTDALLLARLVGTQGLAVTFELLGTYHRRDYCVQYRESDFAFASRLMEEEGILYFFRHTADSHQLVIADSPQSHGDLADPHTLVYDILEGGYRDEV